MAFWWVNHKQSWKAETSRGILWSPLTKSNGEAYQPYSNMRIARDGDVVFSYANGRIGHVGTVDAPAVPAPKPDYASKAPWAEEGMLLPVSFVALENPIVPKDYLEALAPYIGGKHSPIRTDGRGNLSYLSSISDDLGITLLSLAGIPRNLLEKGINDTPESEDIRTVMSDATVSTTERVQLAKARVGQGIFRKCVLVLEPACRVTGVRVAPLLRASHIKPWRESSNSERLDGANGLMLAPHIDLLFDRFLISFADSGLLLVSKSLDPDVRRKWQVVMETPGKPFTASQRMYLAFHRRRAGFDV